MIDFSTLQGLTIPEGNVTKIESGGVVLWENYKPAYAAIYGGDTLVFGRGKSAPETYEGKALTEAYDSANGYDIESMRTNNAASAPWHSYRSNIVSVNAVQTISPEIMDYWFYDMSNCTSMDLKLIESNGSYICTFSGCSSLITLDISNFESSSNMRNMFSGMDSLEKITLGEDFMFITLGNVYNDACLPEGNWKHVETGNVYTSEELKNEYWGAEYAGTYEKYTPPAYAAVYGGDALVFGKADSVPASYDGKALTESWSKANGYDIENANYTASSQVPWYSSYASVITSMDVVDEILPVDTAYWFYGMSNCTRMDLALLNTTNVTNMPYMFQNCSSLTTLTLPEGFGSQCTSSMYAMFQDCSSLITLTLPEGFGSKTTETGFMFKGCSSLRILTLPEGFGSQVTGIMAYMFQLCTSLTFLTLPEGFGSQCTGSMGNMFQRCDALVSLTLPEDFGLKATTMPSIFGGCKALTSLTLPSGFGSNVSDASSMFYGCSSLRSLDVSGFDTSDVTNMYGMFYGCSSLASLDLSSFNTANVTNMNSMFRECTNLSRIYVSSFWSVTNVTSSTKMFYGCTKLKGDIAYNSSYVDKTYAKTSGGYLTYKAAS